VLDEIVRVGRLRFVPPTDAAEIVLAPATGLGELNAIPVGYSGPFRLTVASAILQPFFGDEQNLRLSVRFRLAVEPRLRPLFLKFSAADIRAVARDGQQFTSFLPSARRELPFGKGDRQMMFDLVFKVPKTAKLPAVSFDAKLTVFTAAGEERIVFRDLADARGVSRRRGGVRVRLNEIKQRRQANKKQQVNFQVAVSYDIGKPVFESHRTWMFHNHVYLETDEGRRILHSGQVGTSLQIDGAVAVDYQFDDLDDDWKSYRFVYMAPTLLIPVPVDIGLSGVPVDPLEAKRKQP